MNVCCDGVLISMTVNDEQYLMTHHFQKKKKARENLRNNMAERLAPAHWHLLSNGAWALVGPCGPKFEVPKRSVFGRSPDVDSFKGMVGTSL
jgi:hypothetical protein